MSRSASSAPPSGAAALPAKPAVRVVFIDDDAELRRANSQTLKLHGFQVEAHASARAALPVLTRAFDGVVVTDIRMPDMDGLQLFQRLRDLDAEIPVILITGHGDIATAVQCMREGAYDFLAKPYPAERLIATIGHAAEKRRLVLENRRLQEAAFASGADASHSSAIPRPCCGSSRRCGISPTPTWTCWWKARPAPARKWSPAHCIV